MEISFKKSKDDVSETYTYSNPSSTAKLIHVYSNSSKKTELEIQMQDLGITLIYSPTHERVEVYKQKMHCDVPEVVFLKYFPEGAKIEEVGAPSEEFFENAIQSARTFIKELKFDRMGEKSFMLNYLLWKLALNKEREAGGRYYEEDKDHVVTAFININMKKEIQVEYKEVFIADGWEAGFSMYENVFRWRVSSKGIKQDYEKIEAPFLESKTRAKEIEEALTNDCEIAIKFLLSSPQKQQKRLR